jgi:hypothetical protein
LLIQIPAKPASFCDPQREIQSVCIRSKIAAQNTTTSFSSFLPGNKNRLLTEPQRRNSSAIEERTPSEKYAD